MSQDFEKPCEQELLRLVRETETIEAAILCTVDGLPITHAAKEGLPADALSAMSASILALGDAIAGQTGYEGKSRQVVIESAGRTVAIIHAGENMALTVVGGANINLGRVLGHANLAAKKLLDIVTGSKDHREISDHQAPRKASLEELVKRVLQEAAENNR